MLAYFIVLSRSSWYSTGETLKNHQVVTVLFPFIIGCSNVLLVGVRRCMMSHDGIHLKTFPNGLKKLVSSITIRIQ